MRSYKEDDLTPWRGLPWTVRCQLFSILYQRIVSNVARWALISYVFELLIFSNVDPMSRDVSASGRGFMAAPMLIFCVFHSGIPCPSKWQKIIFKPRESSPRVDGVWTCQIIGIKAFRCKLKRGSQIILGGMGTIPFILQCYPLASLFGSASWHFIQVGHPLPKDGEQKKIIIVFTLLLWWKRALLIDGYWYAFTMVLLFGLLWWVWPMISKWWRWEKNEDRAWIFCSLRRGLVMLDLATGINDWLRKATRSFEFFSSSTGHRSQGIRPCKRILKT